MFSIRQAEAKDIDSLMEGISDFISSLGIAKNGLVFSAEKTKPFYEIAIHNPDVVILVAERRGKVVAGLGAIVTPWHGGNPDILVADELVWYVQKRYRGDAGIGVMLYEAMERRLKDRGVTAFYMSSMVPMGNSKSVDKFYKRLGFEVETIRYVKPLREVA